MKVEEVVKELNELGILIGNIELVVSDNWMEQWKKTSDSIWRNL